MQTAQKKNVQFGTKYWLLSCGCGLGVFLLMSFATDSNSLERTANVLLWPGAAAATMTGYGAHDFEGFFLYLLVNLLFYCALFLVLFRVLKVGTQTSAESGK